MKSHPSTVIGYKIALLLSCALWTGEAPLPAQLILNGGFETPSVPTTLGALPGTETFFATGSSGGITDFVITTGAASLIDTGGGTILGAGLLQAPQGTQYALLNGLNITAGVATAGAPGTLSQAFATTIGQTYQVSFLYAGVGASLLGDTSEFNANVTPSSSPGTSNGTTTLALSTQFQSSMFDFTASSNNSTLNFDETSGSLGTLDGIGLDGVVVTPVPEPAEYAAAAAGFLGLLIGGRLIGRRMKKDGEDEILFVV